MTYKSLLEVEGYEDFLRFCNTNPRVLGIQKAALQRPNPWAYDAARFCHKVFAQFDAVGEDPVLWLDADIVTLKDVPADYPSELNGGAPFTFLGRDSFSECGYLYFNPKHPDFEKFWSRYQWLYHERALFDLIAWTDCHAFDHARKGIEGNNLTPNGKGVDHVWFQSPLCEYMDHLKGPGRKKAGRSNEREESKAG